MRCEAASARRPIVGPGCESEIDRVSVCSASLIRGVIPRQTSSSGSNAPKNQRGFPDPRGSRAVRRRGGGRHGGARHAQRQRRAQGPRRPRQGRDRHARLWQARRLPALRRLLLHPRRPARPVHPRGHLGALHLRPSVDRGRRRRRARLDLRAGHRVRAQRRLRGAVPAGAGAAGAVLVLYPAGGVQFLCDPAEPHDPDDGLHARGRLPAAQARRGHRPGGAEAGPGGAGKGAAGDAEQIGPGHAEPVDACRGLVDRAELFHGRSGRR